MKKTNFSPLYRYTLNIIRRNKATSLSIMAAVLLASTLLGALCIYGYSQLMWRIEVEEYEGGDWHGELGGEIPAQKLGLVDGNLYVEATMLKGPFTCLSLSKESPLPYLLYREADENYWNSMGEKHLIMEGRMPERTGEIAVSKTFFEQNPQYQLGDTVILPEGERRLGEELLDETRIRQKGEIFCRTGERRVTLTGKLDVTTNTTIPGYYAMGWLDRSSLTDSQELVIYVRLRDIRKTYEIMPRLADAVGIEKDEYGQYKNHFRYNARLLGMNLVFPPDMEFSLDYMSTVLVSGGILLLVMGAFVMIICGAFQVSASSRMRQLGMFRSVGATPGQIGLSILMEAVLLSVLPILLSIGIGYLFTVMVLKIYTGIAGELLYFPVTVHFSLWLAVFCAGISFPTVLAAAMIPAVRASRLSPLEAIRMQESGGSKKERREKEGRRTGRRKKGRILAVFFRRFGYEGELAQASHYANRKSFRAGALSLAFSLMLLVGFLALMRLNDFLSERNRSGSYYNIFLRLHMAAEADRELLTDLLEIPRVQDGTCYCVTRMAYWASPDQETDAFREEGGFAGLNLNKWAILERDGKYRIRVYLYGMQEESFDVYCRSLGEDPAEYYDRERIRALALSAAPVYPNVVNNAAKEDLSYPHLKLTPGQELLVEEKTEDSVNGDYVLPVEVGAVADQGPVLGDVRNNYTVSLYVPLSVYYAVAGKLSDEKAGNYYTHVKIRTSPQDDLRVTEQIEEICRLMMADEDVVLISAAREEENNAVGKRAMSVVTDCIGLLLALIGISNTFSAASQTMLVRRREFAMLRSVGMDNRGVNKLLLLEGVRMAIAPVLAGLLAVALLMQLLMGIVDVSWAELFPYMPWGRILLSIGAVVAAVAVSYILSTGRIRRDTIIEAVRDESV